MRFAWTILTPRSAQLNALLVRVLRNDLHIQDALRREVERCVMSPQLRTMYLRGIKLTSTRMNDDAKTFLSECVASLQFASLRRTHGKLFLLRKLCRVHANVRSLVRTFLQGQLQANVHMNVVDRYFYLRVSVMDAYTMARLMVDDFRDAIVYAGANHIKNVLSFMTRRCGFREVPTSDDTKRACVRGNILVMRTIRSDSLDKKIDLIGEDHTRTNASFVDNLLVCLQSRRGESFKFYVEKHVERVSSHTIQSKLMCNMDIALHQIRCDASMDGDLVVPIDSRHFDCGFVRYEVCDVYHDDDVFTRARDAYVNACYTSVQDFVATLR